MCSENKSGRWRRIVCINVMEGEKEIDRGIPTRVHMIGHLSHCFHPNLLTAVFENLLPRTSYLIRTLFSFPSRHFVTSTRHWNSVDGLLRRCLVYRKVSSSRRFHL